MKHRRDMATKRYRFWILFGLAAIVLHVASLRLIAWGFSTTDQRPAKTQVSQMAVDLRTSPFTPPSPPVLPRVVDNDIAASTPTRPPRIGKHLEPRRVRGSEASKPTEAPDRTSTVMSEETVQNIPLPAEDTPDNPTAPDLSTLDLTPSVTLLNAIAAADPRVKRRLDAQLKGPFVAPKTPRRTEIPRTLKYDEIQRRMSVQWTPDWTDIKDDAIAKVSGDWVKRGFANWLKRWQAKIRQHDNTGSPARERKPFEQEPSDIESMSNEVAVEIALEPLKDGSWAVSISKASGHPFFDRATLEEVRKAAAHFPSWKEGYGSALIYRMSARFIIVPPSPSTLIGLTCAFPFCTPDELKEAKLIHWFKKIVQKNVRFLGVLD